MKLVRTVLLACAITVAAVYVYYTYGSRLLTKESPATKKAVDNVLGVATGFLDKQASRSADMVSGFVLRQTTAPLIREFNKLPKSQKEELKKELCR
jgi:predicted MFS family arabinose efflux permease